MAQELERSHSLRITAHHLAVDQAGPDFEVVHGLHHQRIALRPVVAPPGDKPDADRVTTRHEPKPIVLDLVNPIGAGRGRVGGGRKAGFDEARPVGGKPLMHTFDQHAPNLGSRSQESNREPVD